MFQWDESKRQINLAKHRLDFIDAVLVFDGRARIDVPARHPEARTLSVAIVEDVFVTIIWTWRGDARRIISFRRARDEERKAYRDLCG